MIEVLYNTVNIKTELTVKYNQQITELKLEWSNIMSNFKDAEKWQYKRKFHQLETRRAKIHRHHNPK